MPSFTRRQPSSTSVQPPGTSATSVPSLYLLSTGLPSLDDILGGGLPLGSTCTVLAPDTHSAWGRLVERYWIAKGLAGGQRVVVVGEEGEGRRVVGGCMWFPPSIPLAPRELEGSDGGRAEGREGGEGGARRSGERGGGGGSGSEREEVLGRGDEGGKKIAWRYDGMEMFRTSVGGKGRELSLMTIIPPEILKSAEERDMLSYVDLIRRPQAGPSRPRAWSGMESCLGEVHRELQKIPGTATRIVIHELGSVDWSEPSSQVGHLPEPTRKRITQPGGDADPAHRCLQEIHRFLHSLRSLLRDKNATALIILPAHLSRRPPDNSPSAPWIKSLSWSSDATIELKGFADDPALPPLFPTSHGLLTLHSFPTSHHLLPPSLKHSTLLGLAPSSGIGGGGGGAGENNLGFRLKRRKFEIETVHLGVEGGVGERRTEPGVETERMLGRIDEEQGVERRSGGHGGQEGVDGIDAGRVGNGELPRGPKEKGPRVRGKVRFGGEEEVVSKGEMEVSVGNEQAGSGEKKHAPGQRSPGDQGSTRPTVRHDQMDLYEF